MTGNEPFSEADVDLARIVADRMPFEDRVRYRELFDALEQAWGEGARVEELEEKLETLEEVVTRARERISKLREQVAALRTASRAAGQEKKRTAPPWKSIVAGRDTVLDAAIDELETLVGAVERELEPKEEEKKPAKKSNAEKVCPEGHCGA